MNINNKIEGSVYSSDEWNEFKNEVQNIISSSGQTLAGNSLQLQQAVTRFVANASSYTDSGVANAYSLVAIDTNTVISEYIDGAVMTFKAGNANTGSSTLAIAGLPAKTIKKDGFASDLVTGDIIAGKVYNAFYSLADDAVEISQYSATSSGSPDASETVKGILEIATQAEANGGVDDERAITALKLFNRPQGGQVLSTNGYQIFDGGLIIQWGLISVAGGTIVVTLPLAFPNNIFTAVASFGADGAPQNPIQVVITSLSQITLNNFANGATTKRFIAIGN